MTIVLRILQNSQDYCLAELPLLESAALFDGYVSTRFYLLFGTLKNTVSVRSVPVCGNQYGQKRFPPGSW